MSQTKPTSLILFKHLETEVDSCIKDSIYGVATFLCIPKFNSFLQSKLQNITAHKCVKEEIAKNKHTAMNYGSFSTNSHQNIASI